MDSQFDTINARLDEGDQRMARMEGQMAENTAITKRVDMNTAAIVDAFQTLQGAFKVLELLGKLARPLAWIGALGVTLYSFWSQVKSFFFVR
jgi:hypothetical protein